MAALLSLPGEIADSMVVEVDAEEWAVVGQPRTGRLRRAASDVPQADNYQAGVVHVSIAAVAEALVRWKVTRARLTSVQAFACTVDAALAEFRCGWGCWAGDSLGEKAVPALVERVLVAGHLSQSASEVVMHTSGGWRTDGCALEHSWKSCLMRVDYTAVGFRWDAQVVGVAIAGWHLP